MGEKIGCVVAADHLIAASVSNRGGYALAAAAAAAKSGARDSQEKWIEHCLRTEGEEIKLLDRCTVAVGCRDGVSEKVEATGLSTEGQLRQVCNAFGVYGKLLLPLATEVFCSLCYIVGTQLA
jgi:hypothetical protein